MPIIVVNRWSVPPASRASLVLGTYMPGPETTGVLPGIPRDTVVGNVTLSTPGLVYENKTIIGRLSITGPNITVRNCEVQGGPSPTSSGVVTCTNQNCFNAVFEDCTIYPSTPHYLWGGVVGHDYTLRRCNVYGATDIINIHNTYLTGQKIFVYQTGVVIEQSWLHDYFWWTAATPNVVHGTDTETHNDVIQHYGGSGSIIRGNCIDAAFSRQNGHWYATGNAEPFITIPLQSLPDGGPYQHIPDRNITNNTSLTNGVLSTAANGRYNWDDNCCIMINNSQGKSNEMTVEDNWFFGGNFAINGGGNPYDSATGKSIGSWKRNKFDRAQGAQGSGGNNTYTLAFLGGWAGHIDCPTSGPDANVYMDDGTPVTLRT